MKRIVLGLIGAALAQYKATTKLTTEFTAVQKSEEDRGDLLALYGQIGKYYIMEGFDNYAFTKLVVDLIVVVPDLVEDAIYQSYLQIEDPVTS